MSVLNEVQNMEFLVTAQLKCERAITRLITELGLYCNRGGLDFQKEATRYKDYINEKLDIEIEEW